MAVDVPALRPVPDGPVAYRHRIRRLGPLVALAVAGALVLAAVLVGSLFECQGRSCAVKGGAVSLLALAGLPTAMLAGIPWEGGTSRYLVAISTSAVLWVIVGALASQRATEAAVVSWRDWWREYLLLAAGVWVGTLVALGVVVVALGGTGFL